MSIDFIEMITHAENNNSNKFNNLVTSKINKFIDDYSEEICNIVFEQVSEMCIQGLDSFKEYVSSVVKNVIGVKYLKLYKEITLNSNEQNEYIKSIIEKTKDINDEYELLETMKRMVDESYNDENYLSLVDSKSIEVDEHMLEQEYKESLIDYCVRRIIKNIISLITD